MQRGAYFLVRSRLPSAYTQFILYSSQCLQTGVSPLHLVLRCRQGSQAWPTRRLLSASADVFGMTPSLRRRAIGTFIRLEDDGWGPRTSEVKSFWAGGSVAGIGCKGRPSPSPGFAAASRLNVLFGARFLFALGRRRPDIGLVS